MTPPGVTDDVRIELISRISAIDFDRVLLDKYNAEICMPLRVKVQTILAKNDFNDQNASIFLAVFYYNSKIYRDIS